MENQQEQNRIAIIRDVFFIVAAAFFILDNLIVFVIGL